MKKLYAFFFVVLIALPTMAQISTGEPHSSVIPRTGNRPQKGDWGMYIGVSASQVMDLVQAIKDNQMNWYGIPLLNVKYYVTNKLELRMGFEFSANTSKTSGKTYDESLKYSTYEGADFTRFLPGLAYHFSKSNIIDAYVGCQLPIGFNTHTYKNELGDTSLKQYQGTFVIGGGVMLGLQFFIADLPFAIGLEGGLSGYVHAGGTVKNTLKTDGKTEKFYTKDFTDPTMYKKLTKTDAHWGADAAITFTYFFK